MSNSLYRIADEPSPGFLSALTVRPLWPFVAIMFGGAWLSWSWFAINGAAVGSPTKRLEWLVIGGGLLGCILIILGLSTVIAKELVDATYIKYLAILLVVWKLGVTYTLFILQNHSIEIYEYYGGSIKNGVYVLIGSFFVSPYILGSMPALAKMVLR